MQSFCITKNSILNFKMFDRNEQDEDLTFL